jgi:hypothetical protein
MAQRGRPKAEWRQFEGMNLTCCRFPYDCNCARLWLHWQNRIAEVWEDNPPTPAEIDVAETILFDMLSCIAGSRCRDPKLRENAQRQLEHPAFARQRRLREERTAKWRQQ